MPNVFAITISATDKATAVAQGVNKAIAQITKPIADVHASVAAFSKETGLNKLGSGLDRVGNIASDTARRIGSIVPPIAALTSVGTIAGVAAIAHSWGKSAVEMKNTAYNIGMGTTQLQEYQGAAKLAGLSSESMTSGLQSVGKAFEDAQAGRSPFLAGVLSQFNIGTHRVKGGSIDIARAMHDIANAAAKLPNAQARNEFLGFFGAQGLAPLLGQGAGELDRRIAQMRALNATMTPQQIAQGDRYNEAMVALDFAVGKLTNSAGASLAPALTKVANELIPIVDRYGPKLAGWIESIDWDKAIGSTERFVGEIGGLKTVAAAVAGITFAGPIAGAISLVTQLAKVGVLLAPIAANPIVTGILGLTHSKDLNTGESDKLADIRKKEQYALANGGWTPEMSKPGWKPPGSGSTPVASPGPSAVASAQGRVALGIRSNNPLNLTLNHQEQIFDDPEQGIAAAVDNLQRNYQGLTLAQIQDKWTGGARTGNSPLQIANYTGLMSRATGLSASDIPNLSDPKVVAALVSGMIRAENGSMPYSMDQITRATFSGMQGNRASSTVATSSGNADSGDTASRSDQVRVDVHFANPPAGTTARVTTRGRVVASTNIGTSALIGSAI
ncbi:hypothetical protein G3N58_16185 [Paraburkholderia sp. Ac-20342]|uniref:hypothetical protein n=1 Tax=Paraburkholderia sp. Ac-20342 TaxID=2703889 RepID=UPI00197E1A36|nr:hypothetical protein [Paraburkholderia sp. Ac-20342]MBN3848357.1 hypothetical protein [Paraburkholderia sp. Ac-20342]